MIITGVGSYVGKGILKVLEGRRDGLNVMETSFVAEEPGVYRCDEAFFTVHQSGELFKVEFAAIVHRSQPDLVIPVRGSDIVTVARLDEHTPQVRALIGGSDSARLFLDQLEGHRIADR